MAFTTTQTVDHCGDLPGFKPKPVNARRNSAGQTLDFIRVALLTALAAAGPAYWLIVVAHHFPVF